MQVAFAMLPQDKAQDGFQLRQPDEQFLARFRKDRAFDYTYKAPDTEWQEALERWFRRHFPWLYSENEEWIKIFLKVVALAVLVFLIYWLIRNRYRYAAEGKRPDFDRSFGIEAEQVDEVSYPVLLKQALDGRDYMLAVRIHFWYILGLLEQKEFIRRDAHRSNAAYLQEMPQEGLRERFGELVRIFDCVCYGDFRVDEELYESLCRKFDDFQQMLAG